MAEKPIEPKFNIHSSYRKLNIVNPYRYNSGGSTVYEPETDAYISRVEADGGTVVNKDYVNAFILKCKEFGILSNLLHWTDNRAGVKKDANGFVEKTYSLNASYDGVQTITAKKPDGGILFDGNDDELSLGSIPSGDPLCLVNGGSLEVRVNPSSGTRDDFMRVLDKSTGGNYANGYGAHITLANEFALQANTIQLKALNIPNNVFTDVLGTYVNPVGNSEIYFDGSLVAQAGVLPTPNVTANMKIGSWNHSTGREFKGGIEFLRIWNVVLTVQQHNELRIL